MPLSYLLALPPEHERELPVPPEVFGVGAFILLVILMVALLMFGKGRPHA